MGMSFGLFWANRDFLALSTTNDDNRNYYYGLETFFYTNTYVVVPGHDRLVHRRHRRAGLVWRRSQHRLSNRHRLRLPADDLLFDRRPSGPLREPAQVEHSFSSAITGSGIGCSCWRSSKGLAQGYIVTAPAMLVMQFGRTGRRARHDPGRRRHPLRFPALRHRPHRQTQRIAFSSSPSA